MNVAQELRFIYGYADLTAEEADHERNLVLIDVGTEHTVEMSSFADHRARVAVLTDIIAERRH